MLRGSNQSIKKHCLCVMYDANLVMNIYVLHHFSTRDNCFAYNQHNSLLFSASKKTSWINFLLFLHILQHHLHQLIVLLLPLLLQLTLLLKLSLNGLLHGADSIILWACCCLILLCSFSWSSCNFHFICNSLSFTSISFSIDIFHTCIIIRCTKLITFIFNKSWA